LQRHLLAYAGWEWHHFATDNLIASQELDVEETGYTFGLRFEHPLRGESSADGSALGYWLRAGGTVNHIEIENDDGDIVADTDHGLGWEVGGGLTIPLRDRLALTPGVRYRALSRDLALGQTTRSVSLRYVTATVGLTIAF
jgi:opacity protein-like surface antigen